MTNASDTKFSASMVGILLPLLLLIAFGCPQSQGLLKHFFIPSRDYPKAAALDTYSRHSLCNHGKTASGTENDGLRSRAAFLAIESSIGGHFTRNGFCFQEIAALKRTSSSSHRAHSRSALFSSVKHLETQWEISEDSGILEVPEPINLFHSVLCGSHSTFDLAKLPSNGEPAVAVKQKIPIILLHGLLGSARNFQSWMKLVQQKEAQIDGDETKMKTEVMIFTIHMVIDAHQRSTA